jgi:hypothetical protein
VSQLANELGYGVLGLRLRMEVLDMNHQTLGDSVWRLPDLDHLAKGRGDGKRRQIKLGEVNRSQR